ncbi:PI-PLC X domain-containing protein 3, partial [Armadillidium vulgare]
YSLEWGELSPDSPAIVSYIAACIPCFAWPALLRWTVTQRATVYEQLTHGIRYFDIRVAMKNNKFHFVHGLYGADLEDLLAEVRDFLTLRSGEVVLLDFQHLYGLTREDHIFLGDLLKNIFSGLICPPYESLAHLTLLYLIRHKYQV